MENLIITLVLGGLLYLNMFCNHWFRLEEYRTKEYLLKVNTFLLIVVHLIGGMFILVI